jgi:hypothetical protein
LAADPGFVRCAVILVPAPASRAAASRPQDTSSGAHWYLVYIKANSDFLKIARVPTTLCPKLCGKYMEAPASQAKTMTGDISMSKLFGDLLSSLPHFARAGSTTIAGQQALVLHGSDGSTLDVAANGAPYPLRAIAPKSAKAGEITFGEWNAVPAITAPPAGQVVNLSQLTG